MKNLIRHIQQSLALKLSFGIQLLAILVFGAVMGILFVQSRSHIKNEAASRVGSVFNATVERANGFLGIIETAINSNEWLVMEIFDAESMLYFSRRIVA
ncbi:MAG: histidine kinase, partial [Prevotella sp.]|nr:histidine kinase [Prevotella sp.]